MVIYRSIDELQERQKKLLSGANIFYTKEYARFEKKRGNDCIYAGNEKGILLVVIWKKMFFRYAHMPSEPYYFNGAVGEKEEQRFLDQAMELLKPYAYWVNQTDPGANFRAYPTQSKRIPFGNYILDLSLEEEELFKNLTGKGRNMIRRAMKDGVSIRHGGTELLDDYMVCDARTWERSNIRLDLKEIYRDYLDCLGENARIYTAWKDQTIQGGAVFIKNEAMSYYMFGASSDRPSPGALNYLQWRAILDFKAQGVKRHSMVGCRINVDRDSKYHDIQTFKKSFGGELVEGYMFKNTEESWMYSLFTAARRLRHPGREKHCDIIDQEIHKWADLNQSTGMSAE